MVRKSVFYPGVFLYAAASLLLLPLEWVMAALAAAGFHELCHYMAIWLSGSGVKYFTVHASGAVMQVTPMSKGKEILCFAAGPIGSLSLLLFSRRVPKLAICGFVHGLFNLLPVYPLDGGQILRRLVSPKINNIICIIVFTGVTLFALHCSKYTLEPLILLAVCMIKSLRINISCKDGRLRVQ